MGAHSRPSIKIDLNEFKFHLFFKNKTPLTLHFNSPSRKFYLSLIALVVQEMKKLGEIKTIPLQNYLNTLVLLNEAVGEGAGSSNMTSLLHRIYTKWRVALPNLEEAPLFKVLGKNKMEAEGAIRKIYSFTDTEKDQWANLFEYSGSEENIRLKFALNKIGVGLDEAEIIFGDYRNGEAWDQFIAGLEVASIERVKYPLPEEPSIAILPFLNMTRNPKQEFLCDGFTEIIITALSSVPGLLVIARNSTFFYKGKPVKHKQISEELGVRYLLEGSIQKSGDCLRITVQLIDALTGHHIWAEVYDRELKNLFALQDEVASKIVKTLRTKIPFEDKPLVYQKGNITEKILAQRDRIEGERKQVSVLFTHMASYTTLSEKLDEEEVYSLINQVYKILVHKVTEYGGTVNEFAGDGVMAIFGAPIAQEDSPQRAIRASLAIHREIVQFNEKIQREKPDHVPIRMRVGIHTGTVVVGTIGNDLRVSFTAVGDTVNLASRMETLAEPGSTCVSEETFKLTEGLFRFEGLGDQEVKGKGKPIRIFRVIAPSTSRTRFDVSAERGLTPLVGRERELELLLDAFERALQGRGQAVSIVSEAGMGKSRLLYEFRKAVLNEDITFLEGKCLSFSRAVAYQPISDTLKSNFDIRDGDSDNSIRNKVKQGLQALAVEEGPATPYILELLSVKDSGIEKIVLSPEGKKDKTIETIRKLVLKGSQQRPLVMAIEDLHWIDKTSEDVLKYLLESIAGARVLLILTYRTEYIPTWGTRSYHNQILLNRLSNQDSLFIATHLLGTENLETPLEAIILEKTEGIPFFVEEFIKSLKDLGFIKSKDATYRISKELQTIRIPSNIQDIIMARVDVLPEGAKELLQVGSLIEREFSYRLIKAAMQLPEEELHWRLSFLKNTELLYERGLFPDSTLVFKHALTRQVVYSTLLEKRKRKLHIDIGNAIEEVYKDNLEEMYNPLAEHFDQGGDYEKAATYFHWVQGRARRASAYTEAIAFSKKEVACLEKLPVTIEMQKRIIDARVSLANNCLLPNHYVEARDAVAPIVDLAHQFDYRKRQPAIYGAMAAYLVMVEEKHNDDETRLYLKEAQRLALELKDYPSLWVSYFYEGLAHWFNGEYAEGENCFLRIMKMSERAGNLSGVVTAKWNIANSYGTAGRIEEFLKLSQEALHLALQTDDLFLKGASYKTYGQAFLWKGLFPEAEESLTLALEMNQKTDFAAALVDNFFHLGLLCFEMGRYREVQEYCNEILTVYERVRVWPSLARLAQILKVAAGIRGCLNPALDAILTFDLQEIRRRVYQGITAHFMGEIYLYIDDKHLDEAESWIRKAIQTNKKNRMPWDLARAYALYAEFFNKKADPAQAKEKMSMAIELMRRCGADGWVKRYEEKLARL
jgi:TolB-like protein/class 3 adenylate cyclase/tetratricopeptide (TPR) repeat protein